MYVTEKRKRERARERGKKGSRTIGQPIIALHFDFKTVQGRKRENKKEV
jgi:hypothetical protein